MVRPRWRKVWHDLWDNKSRSMLVIASIFIGVFSVGVTIAMYFLIGEDLNTSWKATQPAQIYLYTDSFDPDYLENIRRIPGVAGVEGKQQVSVQARIGADKWIPLYLGVRPDYARSDIDLLKPISGAWPPADRQLLIERASLPMTKAEIGDLLEIQLSDGTTRKIPLVGVVHDAQAGPGSEMGISGYVTFNTLEWLHRERTLSSLAVVAQGENLSKDQIQQVADRVSEYIRKSDMQVYYVYIPPPNQHPGYTQVLGVIAIIGALGFMSLFMAGFLIFNTLSALLVQQVRYVGIMKAIGAHASQVVGMYLVLIVMFGFLALIPAIPLSAYLASAVSSGMGAQLNYESLGFRWVPLAIIIQVIVGLVVPLIAGLLPVLSGVRITIASALSTYGLGNDRFGVGVTDRLVERLRGLSRPVLISIRNTFRRKSRLALTLITLTLGGAIFIAVFNLRSSLMVFIEQIGSYFLADANVSFYQAYPFQEIEGYVMQIPGVKRVEGWAGMNAELLREDGSGVDNVTIIAPPADSDLVEPIILEGRWVMPGDENAIVLGNAFWQSYPDLKVGDELKLKIQDRDTRWVIVGFFKFPGDTELIAYTSYEYLSRLLHAPNRAFAIRIVGVQHTPAAQEKLAKQVKDVLERRGFQASNVQTSYAMVEANARVINIIVGFFLFFALLVAFVGAIGLAGTMGMNVIERTREIGVMRAIGAANPAIFRIVLVEGLVIGFISWLLGVLLSIPISNFLYNILSQALFQTEGKAVITTDGFLIWFVIAMLLSAVASLIPARRAVRMTVRDVLAYE
jgi:putative ABC transport system permease protein